MVVVVSMEMCVQNLYPRHSPELSWIREMLSLNYEPLKRFRCEQFSALVSSARDQTNPFFRPFPRELEYEAMYLGLQVQENGETNFLEKMPW